MLQEKLSRGVDHPAKQTLMICLIDAPYTFKNGLAVIVTMIFRFLFVLSLFVLFYGEVTAGAWTLKNGELWIKTSVMAQTAREEYVAVGGAGREPDVARLYEAGDRARYRENGHYQSRAVFVDVFYGMTDRLDLGVQVPFFDQQFENVGFRPAVGASGFSDIRVFAKWNVIQKPFVGTLTFGVKAPTGQFKSQDGLIPVGEGQWDFDFIGQIGRSFWPLPAYANLDIGYRLRLKNDAIDRDPGDEWFFHAEVGYTPRPKLLLAVKVESLRGKPATVFNLKLPSDIKRVTYIAPTLLIGPYQNLSLETSLRITAGGRNFPAGHIWVIGASWSGVPFVR